MHSKRTWVLSLICVLTTCWVMGLPARAYAIKYMGLKEAIKYFLPEGSTLSKVTKTIPNDKYEATKKRFKLKSTDDFKETLPHGPYTFYIGRDAAKKPTVYIAILEQYWRTCHHKYAIGFEPNGKVKEVVVVELNCRFAYPIKRKSFLKQFSGKHTVKGKKVEVEVGKDIDAISGATMSSESTAIVTRRALALFELFFSS